MVLKSHMAVSGTPQTGKAAVLTGIQMQIEKCFKKKNLYYLDSLSLRSSKSYFGQKNCSVDLRVVHISFEIVSICCEEEQTCFRVRRSTETNYYTLPWKPSCMNVD